MLALSQFSRLMVQRPVVGGGGGYSAVGASFDGTAVLKSNAALTNAPSSSTVGLISFWMKVIGGDGIFRVLLESGVSNHLQVLLFNNNTIRFYSATGSGLVMFTTTAFPASSTWHHILAAWDTSIGRRQVYVNGASDITGDSSTSFGTNYSAEAQWTFGARDIGDNPSTCHYADFYCNLGETLDISNSTNRELFRSAGGAPVDLGVTGSIPTSSQPDIFFKNSISTWQTNAGDGGGFTLTGTLGSVTGPP